MVQPRLVQPHDIKFARFIESNVRCTQAVSVRIVHFPEDRKEYDALSEMPARQTVRTEIEG